MLNFNICSVSDIFYALCNCCFPACIVCFHSPFSSDGLRFHLTWRGVITVYSEHYTVNPCTKLGASRKNGVRVSRDTESMMCVN